MRSIDRVRDAYGALVARILRVSIIGLAMVGVAAAGTLGLAKVTPTGFLPEDDQGALFVVMQLPEGASVVRTAAKAREVEAVLRGESTIEDVTSIIGFNFIDNYNQANAAFMVVTLKPFGERKEASMGAAQVAARLNAKFRQIGGGRLRRSCRRPSSGSAPAADLRTCSKM